ncbi:uncharacterized protein ARMOST_20052 [Armillaria ostoyae]|uniref:Uncharacterized protein n=1 Tax=Armillaria ostoyae TaxID=47428 RepID=A0A284S6D9_ARMOS|nr:uncharacterized protein ARMOST_20052 [Armillaria ostoyae]
MAVESPMSIAAYTFRTLRNRGDKPTMPFRGWKEPRTVRCLSTAHRRRARDLKRRREQFLPAAFDSWIAAEAKHIRCTASHSPLITQSGTTVSAGRETAIKAAIYLPSNLITFQLLLAAF